MIPIVKYIIVQMPGNTPVTEPKVFIDAYEECQKMNCFNTIKDISYKLRPVELYRVYSPTIGNSAPKPDFIWIDDNKTTK